MMITKAKSITHEHLLSILNTESSRFAEDSIVRVLDAGCGDGYLITYLIENLPVLVSPAIKFEVFGFDLFNHGVQQNGFFRKTIDELSFKFPNIPWHDRVACISARDNWPYPDEFFDVIISNHVVEHVHDHDLFFAEIYRTLRWDGYSVHLFPLRHYIWEAHLNLPFVHRIKNFDLLKSYIKFLSRLGLEKFRSHRKAAGVDLDYYSESHADYMHHFTNYISYWDALGLGKKYHLRVSFRYTQEFYNRKVRSLLSLKRGYTYAKNRSIFVDWLSLFVLKYISSVTLFLEKKEIYKKK